MTGSVPHRSDAGRAVCRHVIAFTLVELLVVLGVIALLVAVLVPVLGRAMDMARTAECRANLKQLWQLLHAPGISGAASLPSPESWTNAVAEQGGGGVLRCPSDKMSRPVRVLLADVWIEQVHAHQRHRYPLVDLLDGKCHDTHPGEFFQVYLKWVSDDTLEIRIGVSFDNFDGGVRVVLGESVTFICLDAPNAAVCDSDHALFYGNREVLRLEGKSFVDHHDKVAPWVLSAVASSYGMNAAVPSHGGRPEQVLLLDHDRTIADPGAEPTGTVTEFLAPRHNGMVNTARLDGSVRGYDPDELAGDSSLWHP